MHSYLSDPADVPVDLMTDAVVMTTGRAVDDTAPLICNIEQFQRMQQHIEYVVSVRRGYDEGDAGQWRLSRRFSDFARLHDQLASLASHVALPKKKVFGNLEAEFIENRRQSLQVYLDSLLADPVLSLHVAVKQFLDPTNYPDNMHDKAVECVRAAMRGTSLFCVYDPLSQLGWRSHKVFMSASSCDVTDRRLLASWCQYGPDVCLSAPHLQLVFKYLASIQCPYIMAPLYSKQTASGGGGALSVSSFITAGSVRDMIAASAPDNADAALTKMARGRVFATDTTSRRRSTCCSLLYNDIRNMARQILEALRLLHLHNIPYGHLHSGNILYDAGVCRLCDLHNSACGLSSLYRRYIVQHKRLLNLQAVDVYCFGHVLYELTFGRPLLAECLDDLPDDLSPDLVDVLRSILSPEALATGLPSVGELLQHRLFVCAAPPLPVAASFSHRITSHVRRALDLVAKSVEEALRRDHKLYRYQRRLQKTHALINNEQARRIRQQRHLQRANMDSSKLLDFSESGGSASVADESVCSGSSTSQHDNSINQVDSCLLVPPPSAQVALVSDAGSVDDVTTTHALTHRQAVMESVTSFDKASLRRIR